MEFFIGFVGRAATESSVIIFQSASESLEWGIRDSAHKLALERSS